MRTRLVTVVWVVLGLALAVAWLRGLALERRRDDAFATLQDHAFAEPDPGIEVLASRMLSAELQASLPQRRAVAAAWGVVRRSLGAAAGRQAILARARDLVTHRRSGDEGQRLAEDLVELLEDPQASADLRALVLVGVGDRTASAAALARAADDLAAAAGTPAGDARLAEVARHHARVVADGSGPAGLGAIARASPPLAAPFEAAADAAYGHLDALLKPYRASAAGDADPATLAAVAREIGHDLPGQAARLRAAWEALDAMGLRDRCDRGTLALYAAATRREQLPLAALAICVGMAVAVFGGLALAFTRLVHGRRRIDPAAETVPNVEPIDFDTDAITLQRSTSDETRVD